MKKFVLAAPVLLVFLIMATFLLPSCKTVQPVSVVKPIMLSVFPPSFADKTTWDTLSSWQYFSGPDTVPIVLSRMVVTKKEEIGPNGEIRIVTDSVKIVKEIPPFTKGVLLEYNKSTKQMKVAFEADSLWLIFGLSKDFKRFEMSRLKIQETGEVLNKVRYGEHIYDVISGGSQNPAILFVNMELINKLTENKTVATGLTVGKRPQQQPSIIIPQQQKPQDSISTKPPVYVY
jgi:hypothetical protein